VRVAVVFRGIGPESGGNFTFADCVLRALREIEAETSHRFVYYSTGAVADPGIIPIPMGRAAMIRRKVVRAVRDVRDRLGAPRPRHLSTWFERSLEDQGADFVWFATYYAEDCHLPYIFTVLDIEYLRQPWFPEVSGAGEWERRHSYFSRYIPKATRVIVPNEAGGRQVVERFGIPPCRLLTLHHPTSQFAVDAAASDPAPRDILDRMEITGPYLLYPARLWAHKNHVHLLEALGELNRGARKRFELVCVGSGDADHIRQTAKELGVADAVHLPGFVNTAELVALYQNAHALTYTSMFGPENLPPLEAMALGCPAVVADIPGADEQLGDAALRVSPTDPHQIAEAVLSLEEPKTRRRLIAAGRELAGKRTPARYVQGVLDFLDEFEQVRRMWG
jgi:glycosyltransferase involved in cell wall biosynthesis